ncbi:transcription factor 7-like isoform X1 [Entelurus aequoreus]|uniref:transcription factor 7-like isoform X1 n=1 Tax=Entelurus aequoreus TaxID=161455 RepID=UPI002B1E030C|nr:transcription factor 7-like isoform X1 [Entelurus aequoreus]XP_061906799.1 transcription factor 7-like isoform X1 [Entelurus aequoreus]
MEQLLHTFQGAIEGMTWEQISSTLMEVIADCSPPPTPPCPLEPAQLDSYNLRPLTMEQLVNTFQGAIEGMTWEEISCTLMEVIADCSPPPTPTPPCALEPAQLDSYNQMSTTAANTLHSGINLSLKNLYPIRTIMVVYEILPAPRVTAPAPKPSKAKPSFCRRRKRHEKEDHIKKPPNAFMMFLKENRQSVAAGMNVKRSTEVNTILGQIWRSMTMDEQNKYYIMADEELRRRRSSSST